MTCEVILLAGTTPAGMKRASTMWNKTIGLGLWKVKGGWRCSRMRRTTGSSRQQLGAISIARPFEPGDSAPAWPAPRGPWASRMSSSRRSRRQATGGSRHELRRSGRWSLSSAWPSRCARQSGPRKAPTKSRARSPAAARWLGPDHPSPPRRRVARGRSEARVNVSVGRADRVGLDHEIPALVEPSRGLPRS